MNNKNLDNITMKSSALESGRPLNLNLGSQRMQQPPLNILHLNSNIDYSVIGQSMAGMSVAPNYTEGNRNFCTKHKKKLVNFCLDHGVPLCSLCFKEHQGHRFEMLENYAQAEVTKVQ